MSNKTGFRQGRLGIGKDPIFPVDISGSIRIEGDLVLGGTIADIQGNPIEFGASSATFNMGETWPNPTITTTTFPDWSGNVFMEGAGKFEDIASKNGDIFYNGGNVGIGVSPLAPLHIMRSSAASGTITAGDYHLLIGGGENGVGKEWRIGFGYISAAFPDNVPPAYIGYKEKYNNDSTYGDLIFGCRSNGTSTTQASEYMRIQYNGNVGIGTPSPGYKLHVNGHTHINGTLSATTLTGPLTGNVIGNCSGSAATVTGAAQTEITSVGTLTSLNVSGNLSAGTVSATTLSGNLPWSNITSQPDTITTAQAAEIAANTAKTGSQWITTGSDVYRSGGNVGIGTPSPGYKLEVDGSARIGGTSGYLTVNGNGVGICHAAPANSSTRLEVGGTIAIDDRVHATNGFSSTHLTASNGTQLTYTGFTYSVSYYDVVGHVYSIYDHGRTNGAFSGSGFSGNNWTRGTAINVNIDRMEVYQIVFYSDKRIKTNIEDVPDNLALQTVRDIPCRYYNYRDNEKFNNRYKTIGFIAQEVAEIFPEAILKEKGIIPNIGIFLTNEHNTNIFSWEQDISNNKWKLTIPTINDLIIDNSDNIYEKCKVKFTVTTKNENDYKQEINDASGDLIKIKEIKERYKKEEKEIILEIEDDLQSFIFDEKWDNVFLYGTEVKDLLTVDKQKIFALHHSAIQEIDRLQQADKAEIAELKNKVTTLESTLETVLARITELENK